MFFTDISCWTNYNLFWVWKAIPTTKNQFLIFKTKLVMVERLKLLKKILNLYQNYKIIDRTIGALWKLTKSLKWFTAKTLNSK